MPTWDVSRTVISLLVHRIRWSRKEAALLTALEEKGNCATVEDGAETIRQLVPLKRAVEYVKSGRRVEPLPWQTAAVDNCKTVLAAQWADSAPPIRRQLVSELVSVIRQLDKMRKMTIEDAVACVAADARAILDDTSDEGDDFGELYARKANALDLLEENLDHPRDHAEILRPTDEATGKRAALIIPEGRLHQVIGRQFAEDLEVAPLALAMISLPEHTTGLEAMTSSVALTIALEIVIDGLNYSDMPIEIEGPALAYCAWVIERQREEFDRHYVMSQ